MNLYAALRQRVENTRWYAKRKSYRVLFWREITPLAVPIFLENACVLLMGVLSTFLVSWLGKEAMAGVFAAFYTSQDDVKTVVKTLIWLNAAFMPIWAASWVLPAGLKGARDARFAMWVTMLGMWGCRVVAGYALGIELGMGVVGVWLGMFLDWAVRGALFYWRMVSGRWLWKYPRARRSDAG